jgi:pyridoxal phosphate enzyme (YggS family)
MTISKNIIEIQQLISKTEKDTNRPSGSVLLLAVSKQQSVSAIKEAHAQGINHFGENYLQEGLIKIDELKDYPLYWHFIGPIQSNKTKAIATHFSWVHSINRAKIARALSEHRSSNSEPLQVCLQINLVYEETKAGISPNEAAELALIVSQLPHLTLRGLMTIPPPNQDHYALFIQLKELMHSLNQQLNLNMDTLSMGMSDDIIPAIRAGATILRVGRALFGERL